MPPQLPVHIFLEETGAIALGTHQDGSLLTIRVARNGTATTVHLNKHEARALCQSLVTETARMGQKGSTDGHATKN